MIGAMKMKANKAYSMEQVYQMTGTSRQWHAQYGRRLLKQKQSEQHIVDIVLAWRKKHPRMGSREMYYSLVNQAQDLGVGINKFESIVSARGLCVGVAKRFKPLTSDGKGKDAYPNLINGLIINDISRLIVGDITYFDIRGSWYYIFTLKDVYSQYLLALHASDSLQEINAIQALTDCISLRGSKSVKGCIHHSDNGSQYNGIQYKSLLLSHHMLISRAGNCKQNGSAEQLNHIVKNMYLKHWSIDSLRELKQACRELQYINNHQRTIDQLGHKTPVGFEQYIKSVPMNQRQKKIMHDFTK